MAAWATVTVVPAFFYGHACPAKLAVYAVGFWSEVAICVPGTTLGDPLGVSVIPHRSQPAHLEILGYVVCRYGPGLAQKGSTIRTSIPASEGHPAMVEGTFYFIDLLGKGPGTIGLGYH